MSSKIQAPAISWQNRARQVAGAFLSFLFPPVCAVCRKPGAMFCADCRAKVVWIQEPICQKCGRVVQGRGEICRTCVHHALPLAQIRSTVLFAEPVQSVIHKLKYEGMFGLVEPLADLMLEGWLCWETAVDLVIPIPLHHERKKMRGYNQSELLARQFSQKLNMPMNTHALQRVRKTRSQVGLNITERKENMQAAFHAEEKTVVGKKILLIDDVCTTGATLSAAADALLSKGAESVSAYCLARAT
ncbi:MAG: ComF family protein [Ardenticatenaceae bacterium]|nr:ComF family protein [Ardenticatenaceae bacterium]